MKVVRMYHAGRDSAHRERDRALVRAGVNVTLVVPDNWPGPDAVGAEPFELVQIPVLRPGDVNRHTFAEAAAFDGVLKRTRPDVLDLHEEPFSSVAHQILRRLPAGQRVVTYAAQNIDKRFPPPFAQWERSALRRIDGIYPCSRQAASVVVGKGFGGEVEVLPLATSPAIVPGGQQLDNGPLQLLCVGRFVPEKGVLDAVRVLVQVAREQPVQLELVGEGPDGRRARALAEQLGVADRLTVTPWLDAEALAARYANAHVLLAPSRATATWVEQYGRMVVEAQAAGAVVVSYASGALPEVVGTTGVLVPEGDGRAMGHAVLELSRDPGRWTGLRAEGLAAARSRTWDAVAAGQLALYERVLAGTRPYRPRRPQRARARELYGPPARIDGLARPFALPVLRDVDALARPLAATLDRLSRADLSPAPARIKVVYVDHVARKAGAELALLHLIEALPDVDAHVILAEDGPLVPALESAGATVEVLELDAATREQPRDQLRLRSSAVDTAKYVLRLARRIRQLQPDVVHTNSLKAGYYGSLASRLARVPVVWHVHDRIAEDYLPRRAVQVTRSALRVLPHVVVANSRDTLATTQLRSKGVVINPPVPQTRTAGTTPHEGRVVGIVGRLAPWKGQDLFLQALAALRSRHPGLTGRIVGSAMFGEHDYVERLQTMIDSLGLGNSVTLTGFVDDVACELAGLDLLVHASRVPEPFGQVIVEGMGAGIPVVATRAGGPAEIITDGVDGVLVERGSVRALAQAMDRVLSNPELARALGEAGRQRAADFRPEVAAGRVRSVYESLAGTARD